MDDLQLKALFEKQEIPAPNDNKRKESLNLAAAAFEQGKKSANSSNSSQGSSLWSRLINRHPQNRRDPMAFTKKKAYYGGLATACVALLIYSVAPNFTSDLATRNLDSMDLGPAQTVIEGNALNKVQVQSEARRAEPNGASKPAPQDTLAATSTEPSVQKEILDGYSVLPTPATPPKTMLPSVDNKQSPGSEHLYKWRNAEMERMRKSAQEKDSPAAENEMLADRAMPVEESKKAKAEAAPAVAGAVASMPAPMSPIVSMDNIAPQQQEVGRDKFKDFEQNEIKSVAQEPLSTFSIDVDTASYAFVRSNLDNGTLPQVDSVRVEEMINYFDYAYPAPAAKAEPFKTSVIVKPSPWNKDRKLVTVGIKGYDLEKTATPDSNLVFLLDVSGSMEEPNKLPLLKQSLSMLLETLKPTDKISIVVYAGAAGTVLPPTPVSDKNTILMALQNLQAGGSTAGAEGIRQAYQLAETNFNKDAVNRVILATDGDFNVGITSPDELQDFVERKREKGIFLSVLGFGRGNYNDDMMQRLAQNGNGVAAYIDTLNEARKVLVQEAGSTLFTIAKDVKIQVEFNPATVSEYRLVGYETRALKTEDFNNDKVDAGDIGAGAEVTAIYEITPAGAAPAVDPSRYASSPAASSTPAVGGELAFVKVRYKLPDENTSKLITTPVLPDMNSGITAEAQLLQKETDWAVAVASFAQLLKGGKYTGLMTYDDILKLAEASKGNDPFGYRAEFITLIHKAKTAAAMQTQPTNPPGFVSPIEAR